MCGPGTNPRREGRGSEVRLVLLWKKATRAQNGSVNSSEGAMRPRSPTLKSGGRKWRSSTFRPGRPTPSWLASRSLQSFEHEMGKRCPRYPGSLLVSQPNTSARRKVATAAGGTDSQTGREEGALGSPDSPAAAEDLNRCPEPPAGTSRTTLPVRAEPAGSAGAAPAHRILRSEKA
ncbi:hypothetical protein P7K49_028877 [Saguinus oedipus]|uniref:Uncharacterized protein n=1 Tax=Saguinus oedipus TaxID=9490 RepID=A0ABQ9U6F5_SAGOE|nr:hypothetical protein P7K49_028877 [Saguinus oedipus]